MKLYSTFDEAALKGAWATIGMFDGVHLGHQAILRPMIEQAHAAGDPAVVVTFFPHPAVVLRPPAPDSASEAGGMYLTTPVERALLLGQLGADAVITLTFDRALASLTAEEFMAKMSAALGLRQLWVGSDFALGRNRQGDVPALRRLGEQMGFTVHVTEDVRAQHSPLRLHRAFGQAEETVVRSLPDERISSSAIRALVRQGAVREGAAMLGRDYALEGPVKHGHGRGRQLGFPTANVEFWPGKVLPAFGVYATWTWVEGQRLPSVTSIGVRPTFDPPGSPPRVEAYLMDASPDLYEQPVRVDFVHYLRPELRFDSAQALIDQMILDTQNAREVLAHVS